MYQKLTMNRYNQRWKKPDWAENKKEVVSPSGNVSPVDKAMSNLIKMKEAIQLLKASAPTARKYARLGCYKEYRFGQKLVFYDKQEILDFILKREPETESISNPD